MQPLRREASQHDYRAELFELIRTRSFGRGKIKLASGRESDFYFDLRPTTVHPAGATCVGELIVDALEGINVDFVGGLEMGAVPIATAVAIASHRRGGNLGAFFVRKKPKDHGAKKLVEGLPKGETLQRQERRRGRGHHHDRRLGDPGGPGAARGGRQHRAGAHHRGPARRREGQLRRREAGISRALYGG